MDRGEDPSVRASLNDLLAHDRTAMANERTLLAYVRTSLALVALGATGVEFFEAPWLRIVGAGCVALGGVTAVAGVWRYRVFRRRLADMGARRVRPGGSPS